MINIVSDKNILNGEVVGIGDIKRLVEHHYIGIYEVIRVKNKEPIFLKEHFDRLLESVRLAKIDFELDYNKFHEQIFMLIKENNIENCNIRIHFDSIPENIIYMFFIKSNYPSENFYKEGIRVFSLDKQRENPNIKKNSAEYRDEIDLLLEKNDAFEAVLVNEDKTISEGSKSNIFFVYKNMLITAEDDDVLLGVTRSKVIELAEKNDIKVVKRQILLSEISNFDAAFLTGTSINILPITDFDRIIFDSCNNSIVKTLTKLFI